MTTFSVIALASTMALAYCIDRRLKWEAKQRERAKWRAQYESMFKATERWARVMMDFGQTAQQANEAIQRMQRIFMSRESK